MSEPYEIEEGIPIPGPRWTHDNTRRFLPFPSMSVGSSFFVPSDDMRPSSLRIRVYVYKEQHNTNYITREVVDKNGVPGTRVWRIR